MGISKPRESGSKLVEALKASSLALLSAAFDPSVDDFGDKISARIDLTMDSSI